MLRPSALLTFALLVPACGGHTNDSLGQNSAPGPGAGPGGASAGGSTTAAGGASGGNAGSTASVGGSTSIGGVSAIGGTSSATGGQSAGGSTSAGGIGSGGVAGVGGAGGTSPTCAGDPPFCTGCSGGTIPPVCTPSGWQCAMGDCPVPECFVAADCPSGAYCNTGKDVCPSQGSVYGVCSDVPTSCDHTYDPHCGCFTGKEYTNECEANQAGEPAVPCNGSGGAGGSSGAGGSGQGGGGPDSVCGGLAGTPCGPGLHCAFPNGQCGGDDDTGLCATESLCDPTAPEGGGVCGCDGKIYPNECLAYEAGVDVSLAAGTCQAPSGTFHCGAFLCAIGKHYCELQPSDTGGPTTGECKDLPTLCGTDATCDCLKQEPCGAVCAGDTMIGLTLTCPTG